MAEGSVDPLLGNSAVDIKFIVENVYRDLIIRHVRCGSLVAHMCFPQMAPHPPTSAIRDGSGGLHVHAKPPCKDETTPIPTIYGDDVSRLRGHHNVVPHGLFLTRNKNTERMCAGHRVQQIQCLATAPSPQLPGCSSRSTTLHADYQGLMFQLDCCPGLH
ncbi:uncharacterized protein LOC124272851 [Haliotis rubra]|uniref:uncharacterized protein LOC124272851 n=1 Tax=Haliotis rubra TaxID=36100 RepID=UPI001EE5D6FF|nr:uncharacterized protein LOC124272851 [Haliotis rubra]